MNKGPLPILLNPSAGSGKAGRVRERLEAELRRQGIAYALMITENEDHLRRLTRTFAAERGTLAGAGGDSTFRIMIQEIMSAGARPRLGLIGIGSSNDIPREFGIETPAKACVALKSGTARTIDVGYVTVGPGPRHYFLGQANIGLGAAVNRYVAGLAEGGRRLAGRQSLAGFLGILNAYRTAQVPFELSIEGPDASARGTYVAAIFSNTRFWATGRIIAPQARPDDGALDACLIGSCSVRRLARINRLAKSGRHGRRRDVTMLRSPEFRVTSPRAFLIQADGEIVAEDGRPVSCLQAQIGVRPAALEILVPSR